MGMDLSALYCGGNVFGRTVFSRARRSRIVWLTYGIAHNDTVEVTLNSMPKPGPIGPNGRMLELRPGLAAHSSGERINAPLLCYLVGLARGRGGAELSALVDATVGK